MKLNKIAKHLALAGVLTTLSVSAFAQIMPKEATAATQQANNALYNTLPFADKTDFDNAHKGFVAALPQDVIKGEQGNVIWDPAKYDFIKEGKSAGHRQSEPVASVAADQHQRSVQSHRRCLSDP